MNITIIGTDHIGLITGACLAEIGHKVICSDIDLSKIEKLKKGFSSFYEPSLDDLIKKNLASGYLQFSNNLAKSINDSEVIFIAVGIPSNKEGRDDITYVLEVAEIIGQSMDDYRVIVTKSTVPVGTTKKVKECIENTLRRNQKSIDFDIVSNPDFFREGCAVKDFLNPARVVVGVENDRALRTMKSLYAPLLVDHSRLLGMDITSSELTKYASNAILATKLSFVNELSRLCEKTAANIEHVCHGMGLDPRIGEHFLSAGLGYGGTCFSKDIKALIKAGEEFDEDLQILRAVEKVNQNQRERFFTKIEKFFQGDLRGKNICLWGLSFKPDTKDIGEAPSVYLIEKLLEAKAHVFAFDPVAVEEAKMRFSQRENLFFSREQYEVLHNCDALCLVTDLPEFHFPKFADMKKMMKRPVIFDGRNLYQPETLASYGFQYFSIGR